VYLLVYRHSSSPYSWQGTPKMSFGIGIGDVITVIDKGMLIYDKIKNRK